MGHRIKPEDHTNHSNGKMHSEKAGKHPDHKTAFTPEHHKMEKAPIGKEKGEKKEKWIKDAVKHPGAERKAAAKAGESTHEYMEDHKGDSGTAGKRARLGLTLEKMNSGKLHGTPQEHNADEGLKLPKPETKSYHSEPDGDETKVEATRPIKKGTTVTVSKPTDAKGANKPRSYNTKSHPVVKEGEPALPAGEVEGSGSDSTKGDPSFSPISSANAKPEATMPHFHIHIHGKQA